MNVIGVTIRKIDRNDLGMISNPNMELLSKQILNLHRKTKKIDRIVTEYVIESDNHKGKYHTHLLIHFNDSDNLHNQLSRFVGGNVWESKKDVINDKIEKCYGKWGEIEIHQIYDEIGFRNYMNKHGISKTLI
jgi:hypothetical protein